MNIQEYDLMNCIMEQEYVNQRILSEITGYSLGKVNSSLKKLTELGYLDEKMQCTPKVYEELEDKKPNNAIILAAGFGMRMVPINVEVPKGILEIKGEPLIERLIKQLQEAGIFKIDIVVGFMKEQYDYLIDKYHVNLIYNKDYMTKNNLYSLKCVMDKIGNTYILPCDLWCFENPFSEREWYSWYMLSNREVEESNVRINRKKEIVETKKNELGNQMFGISYILKEEAEVLKENILRLSKEREYSYAFWEEAAMKNGKMILKPREVSQNLVYEINTLEELRELDEDSNQLNSDIISLISEVLSCDVREIVEIKALKKGMTNRSFEFSCRGERYIMRVPGEGTDKMINRKNEYNVYQALEGQNICDPVCYMSPETGYKITKFLDNARVCDPYAEEDVQKCMKKLRGFHECKLQVNHEFDLFGQIEYYESLRNGAKSMYRDYEETKRKVYELKAYIDKAPKNIALTHIDAVPDNFLFTGDEIRLIDWEYAGMQDVHVDIAMFAIYAMYDREHVEKLIDAYFEHGCDREIRIKIYAYIAVCGFLWSNWCEYKSICGVEFGEYSLRQYRYAKDYYKIVKEELSREGKEENV